MRHGKKIRRPPGERQPLSVAPNAVWSMDSVSDALANGRRLKSLTIADDFTHECIDIAVDHGISGACIVRVLKRAARFRGYPRAPCEPTMGPKSTSRVFISWRQQHGSTHLLIEPNWWYGYRGRSAPRLAAGPGWPRRPPRTTARAFDSWL